MLERCFVRNLVRFFYHICFEVYPFKEKKNVFKDLLGIWTIAIIIVCNMCKFIISRHSNNEKLVIIQKENKYKKKNIRI